MRKREIVDSEHNVTFDFLTVCCRWPYWPLGSAVRVEIRPAGFVAHTLNANKPGSLFSEHCISQFIQ